MTEEGSQENTVLRIPVECYSRVVGYLRPLSAWHKAKVVEFHDRKMFDLSKALPEEEQKGK